MYSRVDITKEALSIVEKLKAENGALLFHQSGGCCDGSAPMCFPEDEFIIGSRDVRIGTIAGCNFWMNEDQFEYWKHTHLTVDIVEGRGSSFSLEIPLGYRFIVKSRLFTDEESANLEPITYKED